MKLNSNQVSMLLVIGITTVSLFLLSQFVPVFPNSQSYVTFDTHKFLNAQRVKTNAILGQNKDEAEILYFNESISQQVKPLILEAANGAVVLSKQAVVVEEQLHDITDEVLSRLGLPIDVPSHGAIMINSMLKMEKKWTSWKPEEQKDNKENDPVNPLDLLP